MAKVYFGLPTHNGLLTEGIFGAFLKASKQNVLHKLQVQSYSALCYNFNKLFCAALNERKNGVTHFLLLHADVVPMTLFWVDKMIEIAEKRRADILSVVIPIKYDKGLTSTAIYESLEGSDPYWRPRRLSLHEVYQDYEPTFTDPKLLINTGCMLVDLRKPWVEKISFHFEDKITKNEDGSFEPLFRPEDWAFSEDARKLGARIYATREIEVIHHGNRGYPNHGPWGTEKTDRRDI